MRKPLALGALVALPLVAAACGGGGGGNATQSANPIPTNLSPLAYVRTATHRTATAPTEHVSMKGLTQAGGQQVTLSGSGDFDRRNHIGSMHAEISSMGGSGSIDEVLSGTTIYMKSDLLSAFLPQGKTWLKLDLQKAGKAKGIDFSALLSQSPSRSLAQLKGLTRARKIGTETIDGTETTHYRAHIDISKLPQGAKIEALTHPTYTPFDIWIGNDDGYIRRFKFGIAYVVADGSDADFLVTTDFSDFGKTVDVSEPNAADVYDVTNLALPGLGG